jgi:hypothetical protein
MAQPVSAVLIARNAERLLDRVLSSSIPDRPTRRWPSLSVTGLA